MKDAISAADRACREAKKGLHGNLVVYEKTAKVFQERREELAVVAHLGAGVAPEGVFLVMQPIMSMSAPYASLNFEILLRLREPDGRISPAGKVIAAAENNGRSGVIDRWVMSNTLEWLDGNYDALEHTKFACMNLSGASLTTSALSKTRFPCCRSTRAPRASCAWKSPKAWRCTTWRTRGALSTRCAASAPKIALDDFGAGYTSFAYLKELRADTLKIDGSFVVGVNGHPANRAIVEAIVELARNLGMKSVAEWAEDLPILETLAEIGVDYVQGYAIAKAQLPKDILLAKSGRQLHHRRKDFAVREKRRRHRQDHRAVGRHPRRGGLKGVN
ncbi:MAG: EAL domain-containing protein [Rhodospirillales bacterium]